MGYYAGPAPDMEILSLLQEHMDHAASWAGNRASLDALSAPYITPEVIRQWRTRPARNDGLRLATLYGYPIEIDDTLPPNTIEIRDRDGRVLGRIANGEISVSQTNPNKQTPRPNVHPPSQYPTRLVYEGGGERIEYDIDDQGNRTRITPATGPTQRLACKRCGDTPPPNARFCIECGASL